MKIVKWFHKIPCRKCRNYSRYYNFIHSYTDSDQSGYFLVVVVTCRNCQTQAEDIISLSSKSALEKRIFTLEQRSIIKI